MKKLNLSFICIFCFVGIVTLYIGSVFFIKYNKHYSYIKKSDIKSIDFYLSKGSLKEGVIFARYTLCSEKVIQEPILVKARPIWCENQEIADYRIQELKKKKWVAYENKQGSVTLNHTPIPYKEGFYVLLCLFVLVYFAFLRLKVMRAFKELQ